MHRWHFDTMGTVASIVTVDVVDPTTRAAVDESCRLFDERFSLYRPESELSRFNRGECSLLDGSDALREAYTTATEWSHATAGAFTPERPDGVLDLNGVVKAMAIAQAVRILRDAGVEGGHVGIGGDGESWGSAGDGGTTWWAGIVDPADRQRVLTTVALGPGRAALATSGSAERGDHIWTRPGVYAPVQASVVAADIVTADVLATAIISGGVDFLNEATERWPIHAYVITASGEHLATPGWGVPVRD